MTKVLPFQSARGDASTLHHWIKPWLFSILILPQGIYLGFISTVLPFLLSRASVPVDRIARTTSLLSIPWILCFLWAPLVDTLLRRRAWLVLSACAVAFCLCFGLPLAKAGNVTLLLLPGIGGAVAGSIVLTACGGLIVTTLSDPAQAKASAWYEAGKLTGSAISAALLIWLAIHVSTIYLDSAVAVLVAVPALAAFTIFEVPPQKSTLLKTRVSEIGSEINALVRIPAKGWGILLLASPVGTASAIALLPAVASRYGVGSNGVIWVNGIGGGVLLALGAICSTLLPDSWNRRITYIGAGLSNALASMILLSFNKPWGYFVGTILYLSTAGLCWARFAALVAEIVGPSRPNAAARYSIVATAGNIPLVYMVFLDGIGFKHFGIGGLFAMDAGGNLILALIFVLFRVFHHK